MSVQKRPRKENVRRQAFPTIINPVTNQFTYEYQAYVNDMRVCHDLVAIARSVLHRPDLKLVTGGARDGILKPVTDGRIIWLPKMHPNRRVATKHELAHIYFESDVGLRLTFVQSLIQAVELEGGVSIHHALRETLTEDLCFLINVFDDLRVNSLWGLLFPGDGRDMHAWYQQTIGPAMRERAERMYYEGDIDHFFTYAILLVLGQNVQSTRWDFFRVPIEEAARQVLLKTFDGLLLIVRSLLAELLRTLIKDDLVETPAELTPAWGGVVEPVPHSPGPAQALSSVAGGSRPGGDFDHDDADFDHKASPQQTPAQKARAEELLRAPIDAESLIEALDQAEDVQIHKVQALQREMSARLAHREGGAADRLRVAVSYVDLHKGDLIPAQHVPEDEQAARAWRAHFQRVMGSMRKRLSPHGYELVPAVYISQRLNNQPLVCYRRPQTGRGFRLTLLLDFSGSMRGAKFRQVERLALVLQQALDFPFVDLRVRGFNSCVANTVNILRFPRGAAGLTSSRSTPEGVTPLPYAIEICGGELAQHRHESFLFVITDGYPVFHSGGSGKPISPAILLTQTTQIVKDLHARRVRTFCFMVGQGAPPGLEMSRVFGSAYWLPLREEHLCADAFQLIRDQFLRYLRTR